MKKTLPPLLLTILFVFVASCNVEKTSMISISAPMGYTGGVVITNTRTQEILAEIAVNGQEEIQIDSREPLAGSIKLRKNEDAYLLLLFPGKEIDLTIHADSSITSNKSSDALLNYLWMSQNEVIRENQHLIFSDTDSLRTTFEHFRSERDSLIDSYDLTAIENELLKFQNEARINSFLFYVGRIIHELPPEDPFFQFAQDINSENLGTRTFPNNLLYKYELEYLKEYGAISSISSFTDFIEKQTTDKDLADFLKANYLSELIMSPTYWRRHESLFNSQILRDEMKEEENNKYYNLFGKSTSRVFSAMAGEEAYNFTAKDFDGTEVQLIHFKGKVIFIDSWATWCLPCMAHRPRVLELAEKYKDYPQVQFMMISLDEEKKNWIEVLDNYEGENHGLDLHIEEGFDSNFSTRYNVNFIPKYILIGKDGKIINADLKEPSVRVEQMINEAIGISL